MKKLRISIIFLAVIIALIFISVRVTGLSFSQEKVHLAQERSLHYGPSDTILYKHTGADGRGVVIGKCGDEGLSITHTVCRFGLIYGVDPDFESVMGDATEPIGYTPCDKEISLKYMPGHDMICGMCYNSQAGEIVLSGGTWNDEYFTQKITCDENGFFCISDLSVLYDKESVINEGREGLYYFYAESSDPVDGTDICVNSNMARGLIIDRKALDEMIPEKEDFLSPEGLRNKMNLAGDDLNKINAGIKKYTGIDFFAYSGWCDSETLRLSYDPKVWNDRELTLTFKNEGEGFYPQQTDENMEAAAIGWFKANYGKFYIINNINSSMVSSREIKGKKQYDVIITCGIRAKPGTVKISEESFGSASKTEGMGIELVVEADTSDPFALWKLYYVDDGLNNRLGDIIELELTDSASLFDYTVDELMARITPSRLYFIDEINNMDTKTVASIMNAAAGKTVSKEEAGEHKLDPEGERYDSYTWHCEMVLIDYTEGSPVILRNSVRPGTVDMYCNEYSDIVCVVVTDHHENKKVEYYKDKDLYNMVRHWRDVEEKVDEAAYLKYQSWMNRYAEKAKEELKDDFGWDGKMDLIRFEKQWEFETSDKSGIIEIYRFDYAFTPDNYDNFKGGAGGMHLDGDKRVQGMTGATGQLAFKIKNGETISAFFLGNDWAVNFDTDRESQIKEAKKIIERMLKKKSNWI